MTDKKKPDEVTEDELSSMTEIDGIEEVDDGAIEEPLAEDEVSVSDMIANTPAEEDIELDTVLPLLSATIDEFGAKMQEIAAKLSQTEVLAALSDPESSLSILRKAMTTTTQAANFKIDALKEKGDIEFSNKLVADGVRIADKSPVSKADHKGAVVSGEMARMLILASDRNARTVQLLNSGFQVTIQGPSLSDLNAYYNEVYSDTESYGREYGVHFYLFSDLLIKESTIKLFRKLITSSNLKGWNKGDTILRAISLLDYDTILWAMGMLMYPNGFDHVFHCTNEGCDFHEELKIDLAKLRANDYTHLNAKCIEILSRDSVRLKDLEEYREALDLSTEIKMYDNWSAITMVPTLYDYLRYANHFNNQLKEVVHVDDSTKVSQYLKFNYYKIYAPWIYEIRNYNPDGSVNFRMRSMEDLAFLLDTGNMEESDFAEQIQTFIKRAMITHIAIPFDRCPRCGHVPSTAHHGLIPFDPQQSFFILSVAKLNQAF